MKVYKSVCIGLDVANEFSKNKISIEGLSSSPTLGDISTLLDRISSTNSVYYGSMAITTIASVLGLLHLPIIGVAGIIVAISSSTPMMKNVKLVIPSEKNINSIKYIKELLECISVHHESIISAIVNTSIALGDYKAVDLQHIDTNIKSQVEMDIMIQQLLSNEIDEWGAMMSKGNITDNDWLKIAAVIRSQKNPSIISKMSNLSAQFMESVSRLNGTYSEEDKMMRRNELLKQILSDIQQGFLYSVELILLKIPDLTEEEIKLIETKKRFIKN